MAYRLLGILCLLLTPQVSATGVGTRLQAVEGGRGGSSQEPASFESICNIVDVLGEVRASFEEWQRNDTATLKSRKDIFQKEKTDKENSVAAAKDSLDEANADLESANTESQDLQVQLEATKRSMLAISAEVTELRDRLRAKREEYRNKEASASSAASAASAALTERASVVRRQTIGLTQLQALDRGLAQGDGQTPMPRFRQQLAAGLGESGVTVSALQRAPEEIGQQKAVLQKEMRNEEVEIGKLVAQKEKDIGDIQQDLERLQATYAEKLEKTAAIQRDVANNQRIHDRDAKVLLALGNEFNARSNNLKAYMVSRKTIIAALGSSVGELKGSGCAAASSLAQTAAGFGVQPRRFRQHRARASWGARPVLSFLQTGAMVRGSESMSLFGGESATQQQQMADVSSLGGDPFADVKDKIQQLITAAQTAINEGMQHADWCADEKTTTETGITTKKEDLDVKLAAIRQQKAELARIADETSFTNTEVGRLDEVVAELGVKQSLDKSKLQAIEQEHALAVQCLDQAIDILRRFYNLANSPAPHTGDSSGERLVNELLETKQLTIDLTAQIQRGVGEVDTLSTTLLQESASAKTARVKERDDLIALDSTTADLLAQSEGDEQRLRTELKRLDTYTEELQGECGPQVVDYEARKKRRADEIEALKDALKVLQGEAIPAAAASAAASLMQSGTGMDDLRQMIQEAAATPTPYV